MSNFHPDRLVDLIDHNEIVPAVNQIETHPFFQRAADQELMRERGVQIESWGPFAEGKNSLFTDPMLTEIGEAHGKSVAQVVLRWLIQRDVVVIPKSVRPERMAENLDVFDFELTDDEMARIAALDTGASAVLRPPRPRHGQLARRPPGRLTTPAFRPGGPTRHPDGPLCPPPRATPGPGRQSRPGRPVMNTVQRPLAGAQPCARPSAVWAPP